MKFILKSVLNIIFKIFWNIISMRDISDSCHRNGTHKLISKTWKLSFQKSNNMAVGRNCYLLLIIILSKKSIFIVNIIYNLTIFI